MTNGTLRSFRRTFGSALLRTGSLLLLPAYGAHGQATIPTYTAREELRIVSNDSVPGMLLTSPSGITILPDGRMITTHRNEAVVRVFNPDGKLLKVVGRKGQGPGEFRNPSGAGYLGDTIWVRDFIRGHYQLFDAAFEPIGTVKIARAGGMLYGLTSATTSLFSQGASDTSQLLVHNRDGTLLRALPIPLRIAAHRFEVRNSGIEPSGRGEGARARTMASPLSVSTSVDLVPGGREAIVLESAELWGGKPGQLRLRRVRTETGQVSAPIIVSLTPRKVTKAEADSLVIRAASYDPPVMNEYRGKAKVPAVYPAFMMAMPTADSTVWITEHADPTARLVIDFTGKALMRVRLPKDLVVFAASRTNVWGYLRDADDLPIIVRYRLSP